MFPSRISLLAAAGALGCSSVRANGAENDWVLLLDDAAKKYPAPGSRP